jgi:DNA-binding CsgD family transcriptional regulator
MYSEGVLLDYQAEVVTRKRFTPMGEFTEQLRTLFESDACVLASIDSDGTQLSLFGSAGIQLEWVHSYEAEFGAQDPWMPQLARLARGEEKVVTEDTLDRKNLVHSIFYKGWMHPQGFHHAMRGAVGADGERTLLLLCVRGERRGPYKRSTLVGLRYVLPTLRQIQLMSREARRLTIERDAVVDTLDQLTLGVVLIDSHGKPVSVNRSASDIIKQSRALTIDHNGIFAAKPQENIRLRGAIQRATSEDEGADVPTEMVPISRPSGASPITVAVSRLKTARTAEARKEPVAALFVADPDSPIQNTEDRLCSLYALTRLEARLALRIAHGLKLEEISSELRISIHTARAYLKQVFAKTSVHRQSALVRLLVNGASHIRSLVLLAAAAELMASTTDFIV